MVSHSTETFTPDSLIGGDFPLITRDYTLLTGQSVVRGAVLGKVTLDVDADVTADGGNTGDGVFTLAASNEVGPDAKTGDYIVTCIAAATDGGRFQVVDPDGNALGDALVGTAFTSDHINFTIADGATDFAVGDFFTVSVAAGSGKLVLSLSAAKDGSNVPYAIAAATVDASAADKGISVYLSGEFNEDALTLGTGHTVASIRDGFRDKGIHLKSPVSR